MNEKRTLFNLLHPPSLLVLGVFAAGCSEELGPRPLVVTRVTGIVREGNRPVSGGWIEFLPVDGTVGNLCSARLGKDGSFTAAHVAVGRNLVRLVDAPIAAPGAATLFQRYDTTPIRRVIPERPDEPLFIDLLDELTRYGDSVVRKSRHASGARRESR
jgi:hypothetical protein